MHYIKAEFVGFVIVPNVPPIGLDYTCMEWSAVQSIGVLLLTVQEVLVQMNTTPKSGTAYKLRDLYMYTLKFFKERLADIHVCT